MSFLGEMVPEMVIKQLGKWTTKIDLLSRTHFMENFSMVLMESLTLRSPPKYSTSRSRNYVLRTFRSAVGFLSFTWANEMYILIKEGIGNIWRRIILFSSSQSDIPVAVDLMLGINCILYRPIYESTSWTLLIILTIPSPALQSFKALHFWSPWYCNPARIDPLADISFLDKKRIGSFSAISYTYIGPFVWQVTIQVQ